MNAALARLPESQQRALAVLILALVIAAALAAIVVPVVLMHRHYDVAIADFKDRLQRYQRIAAQAPEYRKALDAIRERDTRKFVLKNTAPNLAGAELQEIVRAAVEGNGGRITTSQN
ncbi:MAG TPA: type II secretion system protein GspM, partial [Rudaea sp.]|nr:type II secretion system protein GspM [Rudaea sp.]